MSSATAAEMSGAVERHASMDIRNVTFKIEDCVFRVPIQMFGESQTFCDMLERVTSQDPDAQPSIPLDGIGKDDFLYFLQIMYQRQLGGEMECNTALYTALLKLSTNWRFLTVRTTIIRGFPNIDLIDKIVLSRDYSVKEWFVSSLDAYVRIGRSITLQDVEKLGLDYILKIVEIRDRMDRGYLGGDEHYTYAKARMKSDFQSSLASLFGEEIIQSQFEPSSPVASNVEDFNLVDIYFLVENQLFKSYRQCFEISPVFREMFSIPVGMGNMPDGCTEHQPLQLEGITRSDFAPFIDLINPGAAGNIRFSLEQWISILKLSTMWDFIGLRQHAMREIAKLNISPARKISLARDHRIQDWLLPALNLYTRQVAPVTAEDVDLLGWDYILKILRARETSDSFITRFDYQRSRVPIDPAINARTSHSFTEAINLVFRDEIRRVESYGIQERAVPVCVG